MESILVCRLLQRESNLIARDVVWALKITNDEEFFVLINSNSVDVRCKKITKRNLELAQSFVKGYLCAMAYPLFTFTQWKDDNG